MYALDTEVGTGLVNDKVLLFFLGLPPALTPERRRLCPIKRSTARARNLENLENLLARHGNIFTLSLLLIYVTFWVLLLFKVDIIWSQLELLCVTITVFMSRVKGCGSCRISSNFASSHNLLSSSSHFLLVLLLFIRRRGCSWGFVVIFSLSDNSARETKMQKNYTFAKFLLTLCVSAKIILNVIF